MQTSNNETEQTVDEVLARVNGMLTLELTDPVADAVLLAREVTRLRQQVLRLQGEASSDVGALALTNELMRSAVEDAATLRVILAHGDLKAAYAEGRADGEHEEHCAQQRRVERAIRLLQDLEGPRLPA